jgi:hypothetical protein
MSNLINQFFTTTAQLGVVHALFKMSRPVLFWVVPSSLVVACVCAESKSGKCRIDQSIIYEGISTWSGACTFKMLRRVLSSSGSYQVV